MITKSTMRTLTMIALGAATVTSLAAQERRARIWVNGEEVRPLELIATRRARIGVTLDMRAIENDSVGATIASVTPGGPAADAGIQSGDIITRFNGRSLVRSRNEEAEDESLAAIRLIEMVARLEPGDTVTLEYRRGRETRTARIVTARERDLLASGRFEWLDEPGLVRLRQLPRVSVGQDPGEFFFRFGGPLSRIELAPMNADLGAYFGTVEGVLVIDAPRDNSFGLKGGDVIVSVDGRKATGPSSLHRILASYDVGDSVKLEVVRNRSRQTLTAKIERRDD